MSELGGFADVARHLTRKFGLRPPLDRRQIHRWHERRTLNAAGQMPPSAAVRRPQPKRTQPRYLFEMSEWERWYEPGVPAPSSSGVVPARFETADERNARWQTARQQAMHRAPRE